MSKGFRTWLKFNAVGLLGVGIQLAVLALLKAWGGFQYLTATVIAVETAVLHNFAWHEHWTWIERTKTARRGLSGRLLRFHVANGVVSICGNLGLMWLLVSHLGANYLAANAAAIAVCSLINFWASDRLVF
jgi:putative flippase GtrA